MVARYIAPTVSTTHRLLKAHDLAMISQTAIASSAIQSRRLGQTIVSRWLLVLVDAALINLGFVLGYFMRYVWNWFAVVGYEASFADYIPIQIIFTLAFLLMFRLDHVYSQRRTFDWFDQAYGMFNASLKAMIILQATVFVYRPLIYSRLMLVEAAVAALLLTTILRVVIDSIGQHRLRNGIGVANVLIVGAGEIGRAVMRVMVARPELGLRCIGFVDDDPERGTTDIGRFPALGHCNNIASVLQAQRVDEMVITLPWNAQSRIFELVALCNRKQIVARVSPSLLQLNLFRMDVDDYGGIPLLTSGQHNITGTDQLIKRVMDIFVSSLMLVLSAPIIALMCLVIRIESPGSPIFSHTRIGKAGRPFTMFKLRSMKANAEDIKHALMTQNEADGPLFKMKEDPRTTRVGRFIRRTSIDELLQFWNVLKGDMSVVGPRPHVPAEVASYTDWHRPRLNMRPGITGLSQISGRSELSFDETALLDLYYIENWSLSLDMRIMLKTPVYLLTARGAY